MLLAGEPDTDGVDAEDQAGDAVGTIRAWRLERDWRAAGVAGVNSDDRGKARLSADGDITIVRGERAVVWRHDTIKVTVPFLGGYVLASESVRGDAQQRGGRTGSGLRDHHGITAGGESGRNGQVDLVQTRSDESRERHRGVGPADGY